MNSFWESIVTITTAIVGLAVIATLVSKNSNTANIIQNASSGFANSLGVAVSPVTGSSYTIDTSYAGSTNFSPSSFG